MKIYENLVKKKKEKQTSLVFQVLTCTRQEGENIKLTTGKEILPSSQEKQQH